jgi:hypothetical protein
MSNAGCAPLFGSSILLLICQLHLPTDRVRASSRAAVEHRVHGKTCDTGREQTWQTHIEDGLVDGLRSLE